MPEMMFRLKHDRKHYRDLFHNEDFHFFSKRTNLKVAIHLTIAFSVFTIVTILLNIFISSFSPLITLGIMGILGGVGYIGYIMFQFLSWKHTVSRYSKQLAINTTSTLRVSEKGLMVHSGETSNVYQWKYFNLTKFSDSYIILTNKETTSLVIPSACMKPNEFKRLNSAIREKLQQQNMN